MSDPDEIVGHKTFSSDDGLGFRHEPLTRREADAMLKSADDAQAKRATDMPTEQDAVDALWSAQQRLRELGWAEPRSFTSHELRQEGAEAMLVEFSSSGIHRGTYRSVNGKDVWWIGPHGSPSHPVLVRPIAATHTAAASTRNDLHHKE